MGFSSATTLNGSTTLPFVIPTEPTYMRQDKVKGTLKSDIDFGLFFPLGVK